MNKYIVPIFDNVTNKCQIMSVVALSFTDAQDKIIMKISSRCDDFPVTDSWEEFKLTAEDFDYFIGEVQDIETV